MVNKEYRKQAKISKNSCIKCRKRKSIVSNGFCRECFIDLMERRIRRYLSENELIHKDDILTVHDKLSLFCLKRAIKGLPVRIEFRPKRMDYGSMLNELSGKTGNKKQKAIVPWTVDHENHYFLENMFKQVKPKFIGILGGKIKLFAELLDSELALYAKFNKISYKPQIKDNFMDSIAKRDNNLRFSMKSAVSEIARL